AITIHTVREPGAATTAYEMRCWLAPGAFTRGTILSPDKWLWHAGACEEPAPCPLAAARGDWLSAREALPNRDLCACAGSVTRVIAYVATLLTLLRADGVEHQEYLSERLSPQSAATTAAPRQATSGRKGGPAAGAARPQPGTGDAVPIRWVRVSLSRPSL